MITGIVFLGLGRGWTGVSGGGSKDPIFCMVGSIGEPLALCFLRLRVTSVNSSSWLTDVMMIDNKNIEQSMKV